MSCLPKLGETRVIELMWVGMRMLALDISGSRVESPRLDSVRVSTCFVRMYGIRRVNQRKDV